MEIFADYADYYNIFYADKDYFGEVEYIDNLIKTNSKIDVKKILNIGCGTGNHDQYLAKKGYQIDAFDMSEKMIIAAKQKKIDGANFFIANTNDYKSNEQYDCIISLFHVLSYHTTNQEVKNVFEIVKRNLKPGGIFVFDFWYGPGVLNDQAVVRVKEFETEIEKIVRIAEPEYDYENNCVNVNYTLFIQNKNSKITRVIKETHKMRYFFKPELELMLENSGLKSKCLYQWLSEHKPDPQNWNSCFVGLNSIQ